MFDVTDLGYEGKFDFSGGGSQPEQVYMLASVPRTGSSYLSHLLWQTGCLGAPLEYLNYEGPYAFAAQSVELQAMLWRSVLRRRTSPNGVFGFKCFPMQLQALHEGNPELLSDVWAALLRTRPARVVYLQRRDRVAHAVSYARATLSGIWRKEQEAGRNTEVEYSEAALRTAEQWIDVQANGWETMFRDLRIEPLRIWYEDVLEDSDAVVRQVADYLGVAIVPEAAIAVPLVQKQAEADFERLGRTLSDQRELGRRVSSRQSRR